MGYIGPRGKYRRLVKSSTFLTERSAAPNKWCPPGDEENESVPQSSVKLALNKGKSLTTGLWAASTPTNQRLAINDLGLAAGYPKLPFAPVNAFIYSRL
jgi:hypothetical protein